MSLFAIRLVAIFLMCFVIPFFVRRHVRRVVSREARRVLDVNAQEWERMIAQLSGVRPPVGAHRAPWAATTKVDNTFVN